MVKCPKCKSEHTARILYGMPTYEAFELAERGELILGGCEIWPGQPDYGCLDCKFQWSKGSLPVSAIKKMRFKVWENGPGFLEYMKTWVYEIYPEGKMIQYLYYGKNRKYSEREVKKATVQKVEELYKSIQEIVALDPMGIIECRVCDGCSYQLQVSYIDGRKEIIDGDVGSGTVDGMLMSFINKYWADFMEE